MYLNASIPRIECLVRKEFLFNLEEHHGEFVPATIFGIASIGGRALGFHALLDNGAMIWRLPIHALVHKETAPPSELHELQLWNCFGYDVSVTEFDYLTEAPVLVELPSGWQKGAYLFTVDWCGNIESEDAGPGGHKCAHIIELEDGRFAAQPNNKLCVFELSKVKPFMLTPEGKPDYRIMRHTWNCETGKLEVSDDDKMFYDAKPAELREGAQKLDPIYDRQGEVRAKSGRP